MATVITIPSQNGEPTVITVDATPVRRRSMIAEITEEPVESGGSTSDHYRTVEESLSLDVFFTNQPITPYPDFASGIVFDFREAPNGAPGLVLQPSNPSNRVALAREVIERTQREGVLIEIATPYARYQNVAIAQIQAEENADNGDAWEATLDCRVVRMPTTATAAAPVPVRPRGRGETSAGNQAGETNTDGDEQVRQSLWHRLAN